MTMEKIKANFENLTENDLMSITKVYSTNGSFPLEVFPLKIQDIINATVDSLDFPLDFIGASVLSTISIATANTYKVQVKNNWIDSPLIYMALVGRSGTNKTHPLSFALNPILNRDKKTYHEYEVRKQEYDKFCSLSAKDKKDQGIEEQPKPVWEKNIISDFTPEALAQVHKFNKRGIAVYIDELAGWFKNFNRYNSGSEMEFWLSSWSCKPINIDRKSGDPVFIASPFIPVVGTIQNKVLVEMSKSGRNDNGFIDRILFAIPDNLTKPYWSDKELEQSFTDSWFNIINNLLNINLQFDENLNPVSNILLFDKEAKKILSNWQIFNTDLANNTANENLSGVYSKLETYVIRLALILEMADYACNIEIPVNNIGVDSVNGAIKLIEYFRRTAEKVNAIINNENIESKLSLDKIDLLKSLPDNFTTNEAINIGNDIQMNEKFVKRFISDTSLFTRTSHGNYSKLTSNN